MRYRLRTLLIALAFGPPVLAGMWYVIELARFWGVTWQEARYLAWSVGFPIAYAGAWLVVFALLRSARRMESGSQ